MMQLKATVINDVKTLNQAKYLLYDCYIKKLGWEIAIDNQSGIKIEDINNRPAIVDDYDDFSIWFSMVQENELIACARLCKQDSNGLLEIERYDAAKKSLQHILNLKRELNILELNREAISLYYAADKTVGFLLLRMIFAYCLRRGYAILTTTNISEWVGLYDDLLFPRLDDCKFKYSYFDPKPVEVYFAKTTDIRKMLYRINSFVDRREEHHVATLCFS